MLQQGLEDGGIRTERIEERRAQRLFLTVGQDSLSFHEMSELK